MKGNVLILACFYVLFSHFRYSFLNFLVLFTTTTSFKNASKCVWILSAERFDLYHHAHLTLKWFCVNSYKFAIVIPCCMVLFCPFLFRFVSRVLVSGFYSFIFFTPLPLREMQSNFGVCEHWFRGLDEESKTCHPRFSVFTHCNLVPFDLITPSAVWTLPLCGRSVNDLSGWSDKIFRLRSTTLDCCLPLLLPPFQHGLKLYSKVLLKLLAWSQKNKPG